MSPALALAIGDDGDCDPSDEAYWNYLRSALLIVQKMADTPVGERDESRLLQDMETDLHGLFLLRLRYAGSLDRDVLQCMDCSRADRQEAFADLAAINGVLRRYAEDEIGLN